MKTVKELQQQINQHFQELVDETDKARSNDEMLQYLDCCAKFHAYSPNNIWLILLARPDATHVAGFQTWKGFGRWVRKGEQGIAIFAPLIHREKDEDDMERRTLLGFKIVYVFDIQQTEGQPLSPQPNWKSPEKHQELNQRLIEYAESQSISVTFRDLDDDIQGISRGGAIEVDQQAGTKTLIHEIAHELLHQGNGNMQTRVMQELEAESIAYVVSRYFGIENLNCPNYLVLHGISREEFQNHINIIQSTAHEILMALIPES